MRLFVLSAGRFAPQMLGRTRMLIDSLTFVLEKSGALDDFWGKLDAGTDATLGVASSARPFLASAQFSRSPRPTLVVVAGEDAAIAFARNMAAYLGEDRVLLFPERADTPFSPKTPDARKVARRMEAAFSLACGRPRVVVASARALIRMMPPKESLVAAPLVFEAGIELADTAREGEAALPGAVRERCCVESFEDAARALEDRGYVNTGELDGQGTFGVHGGTIDVFPGNLTYPVRIDFFGDEVDEIRRIVPSTGQTISPLSRVEIYPVREYSCSAETIARARRKIAAPAKSNAVLRDMLEKLDGGLRFEGADALLPYLYDKSVTLGAWAGPDTMTCLIEPRSLFDDATHAYEEIEALAKGTKIPVVGLYARPTALDFGGAVRSTGKSRRGRQHGGSLRAGAARATRHRACARRQRHRLSGGARRELLRVGRPFGRWVGEAPSSQVSR